MGSQFARRKARLVLARRPEISAAKSTARKPRTPSSAVGARERAKSVSGSGCHDPRSQCSWNARRSRRRCRPDSHLRYGMGDGIGPPGEIISPDLSGQLPGALPGPGEPRRLRFHARRRAEWRDWLPFRRGRAGPGARNGRRVGDDPAGGRGWAQPHRGKPWRRPRENPRRTMCSFSGMPRPLWRLAVGSPPGGDDAGLIHLAVDAIGGEGCRTRRACGNRHCRSPPSTGMGNTKRTKSGRQAQIGAPPAQNRCRLRCRGTRAPRIQGGCRAISIAGSRDDMADCSRRCEPPGWRWVRAWRVPWHRFRAFPHCAGGREVTGAPRCRSERRDWCAFCKREFQTVARVGWRTLGDRSLPESDTP